MIKYSLHNNLISSICKYYKCWSISSTLRTRAMVYKFVSLKKASWNYYIHTISLFFFFTLVMALAILENSSMNPLLLALPLLLGTLRRIVVKLLTHETLDRAQAFLTIDNRNLNSLSLLLTYTRSPIFSGIQYIYNDSFSSFLSIPTTHSSLYLLG